MSKKLYVGSLSWDTNDQGLRQAFEAFGEVSDAVVISDRETGRSRGFGFVTFEEDEAAREAVEKLDGTALDGRNIKVNEARERQGGRGGGGGRSGGGGYGGGGGGGGYGGGGGGGYGGGGGGGGDRW